LAERSQFELSGDFMIGKASFGTERCRLFIADFYPTWLFSFWATPAMRLNFGGTAAPSRCL
jgi:hypothetical protein